MDKKQIKVNQANTWEYIPDPDTILQYLERKDLIEFSKCCKRYRNQLKSRVFENLSLETWERNNKEFYYELKKSRRFEEALEPLKISLGTKLKFVKIFTLHCEVGFGFAEIFVKLLPNIKTLKIMSVTIEFDCWLGEGLPTIFKGMVRLEHLYLYNVAPEISCYNNESQVFSKSIKSLEIGCRIDSIDDDILTIYDTIDTSYINLHSLTIVTNRMLQNLSSGMPNLKEVKIKEGFTMDQSKLVAFLKANRQIKKLCTDQLRYNEEILNTVLSSKYFEYWDIYDWNWRDIDVNTLQSNYSIKYLIIDSAMPAPLTLQLINVCKILEALELEINHETKDLDWSKLDRKINKLKLRYSRYTTNIIKEIDALRIFNSIHIEPNAYTRDHVNKYINFKLNNYMLVPSLSKSCTLKLINKTE
ncbi:hypothetical protein CONCODRAFT_11348 [Conidiobolus coronatus NRRL 28638]|uniref:F-box domain-containing protein n=1 Tax=Conidiobolus coronatus (strain ATCC 28846 / CBS 209.66 / NRRL 28638) TaxID=796925 RepID=A0A137NVJ5_CONC2|nr:hypothetical protein CONCODRAFT_11348 [Conidiobolus coronatus NRRL 28638]|eukprot:KXN66738.1 hypothetical protein CONCODRAFT_11348 [Conidiobolus coronatus NRRL 28638]